ncbi:MAG: hypothetical protein E7609_02380 [Ruminococcaceae bacterium]|nr:hypothetical protein [Oscillospiraceae bacterium]
MSIKKNRHTLNKGWKYFDVMHMDRRVARIYESGKCTVNFPSFMPYNLYFEKGEDTETCVNNLSNFYYWCASRVLTLDRKYAKEILNSIGAIQACTDRERAAIAISYRALSLIDVYWVRARGDEKTFKEISLYDHSLSTAFVDVSLKGKALTVANTELIKSQDQAGDIGTPGVAPKAWIRKGDTFYLLKDGDERDVSAELLASKIVSCFDVAHVCYEEAVFDDMRVSRCEIITSKARSIVPIEYFEIYCANRGKRVLDLVLKKDSYAYYMMNILDYLIGNTDRHWGNWGFVVDNATNKPLKLYPLMDFNKAFTSYETVEGARVQTTTARMSQRMAAIDAVKTVGLNQIKEIDPAWFDDPKIAEMFFARLALLKEQA